MTKKDLHFSKEQLKYIDDLHAYYTKRISACCEALERATDYQLACDHMVEMGIISGKGVSMILASVSKK